MLPLLTAPFSQCGTAAKVFRDPHINFAYGGSADLRGRHNALYNFLSAPGLSVNVKTEDAVFKLHGGALTVNGSFLTEAHVTAQLSPQKFATASFWASELDPNNFGWSVVNGTCVGRPFRFGFHGHKKCFGLEMTMDHSSATFKLGNWTVKVHGMRSVPRAEDYIAGPDHRLDIGFTARGDAPARDMPHGIIGQSYATPGLERHGKKDIYPFSGSYTTSAQAEGAIEGTVSDYEAASTHATDFAFSRFSAAKEGSVEGAIADREIDASSIDRVADPATEPERRRLSEAPCPPPDPPHPPRLPPASPPRAAAQCVAVGDYNECSIGSVTSALSATTTWLNITELCIKMSHHSQNVGASAEPGPRQGGQWADGVKGWRGGSFNPLNTGQWVPEGETIYTDPPPFHNGGCCGIIHIGRSDSSSSKTMDCRNAAGVQYDCTNCKSVMKLAPESMNYDKFRYSSSNGRVTVTKYGSSGRNYWGGNNFVHCDGDPGPCAEPPPVCEGQTKFWDTDQNFGQGVRPYECYGRWLPPDNSFVDNFPETSGLSGLRYHDAGHRHVCQDTDGDNKCD